MRINKGAFVQVQYRLLDREGSLIEETTKEQPMEFIYGMGLLLPAFEAELSGKEPGDKFDFHLSPENAYGEVREDLLLELDKKVFHVDGKFDEEMVYEGAKIPMNTADGQVVHGKVTHVGEDKVKMDFNHDLAGEKLHFIGEVTDVREPSQEEYDRFFGHHGCSSCCGCGDHHHEHGEGHHEHECGEHGQGHCCKQ